MERDEALDTLAAPYTRALRMADAGREHAEIAAELAIDIAAVAPLLAIGERKLARAMGVDDPDDGRTSVPTY